MIGAEQMRHALGVWEYSGPKGPRWSKPHRNYFVAGGDDAPVWEVLVAEGLATKGRDRGELTDNMPVYSVTDAGRRHHVQTPMGLRHTPVHGAPR